MPVIGISFAFEGQIELELLPLHHMLLGTNVEKIKATREKACNANVLFMMLIKNLALFGGDKKLSDERERGREKLKFLPPADDKGCNENDHKNNTASH